MNTIYHDFTINVSKEKVFGAVVTPKELNNWWTLRCSGKPALHKEYNFYFAEEYNWFAIISKLKINEEIEFCMTKAMEEWMPTRFGFILSEEVPNITTVQFYHTNWKEISKEFRVASFCWADLLRQLKQYLEKGIITPFEQRN